MTVTHKMVFICQRILDIMNWLSTFCDWKMDLISTVETHKGGQVSFSEILNLSYILTSTICCSTFVCCLILSCQNLLVVVAEGS